MRLKTSPDMDPPRIMYVVNDFRFFLSHRLPIALAAQRRGAEILVACPHEEGFSAQIESFGFTPISLEKLSRWRTSPQAVAREVFELVQIFRQYRPTLLHLVTIKPVLLGSLASRAASVPAVVCAVSGMGFIFISRGWWASLRRLCIEALYRFALGRDRLRVVFQNPDDREYFERRRMIARSKSVLIRGSGADPTFFSFSVPDLRDRLVVVPARMLTDKGIREVVEAGRILKSSGVECRIALVGEIVPGNPAAVHQEVLSQWVREGVVEYWGQRTDMAEVFRQSSIVCLPSYREGLPKALVEAAAVGRAIVTTDVPGCRELVREGFNGLLVPVRDAVALADRLTRLLTDPDLCIQMGRNSFRHFQDLGLSTDDVVGHSLRLYEDLGIRLPVATEAPHVLRRQAVGSLSSEPEIS